MVRKSYTYSNNGAEIARLLKKKPQYQKVVELAKKTTEYARNHFADDSSRMSGWGHDFVCPKCASQMIMDLDMPYNPPHVFTCPNCGATASSDKHDMAWVYYYRAEYAVFAESAALCAVLGDQEALAYLIRYIDFYADRYHEFPEHGWNVGIAKVMEQNLDEAVWAIALLRSLAACRNLISAEKKDYWYKKLFRPIADLLTPQIKRIHNIDTWMMCALGMISLYFNDHELFDHAVYSTYGLSNQITQGYMEDGIWYEGSLHYHYYTSEGLTYFFTMLAERYPEDPLLDMFIKMYAAPLELSHDQYTLQSVNDGWYPRTIATYARQILMAARVFSDDVITGQVQRIWKKEPEALMIPLALLFEPVEDDVVMMEATKLAVLKKPFHMILKSSVLCLSHRHRDNLSVVLAPFSDDLGTPGYAHVLVPGWYRQAPSHNTICVDGAHPYEMVESRVEKVEDGIRAVCQWPGLTISQRTLTVEDASVRDVTVLESEDEHVYDWFFHSMGTAQYSWNGEAGTLEGQEGYEYLEEIQKMNGTDTFIASFTLESGEKLTITIPVAAGMEVFTGLSPSNPADIKRNVIILRQHGKKARFEVKYER